MSSDFLSIKKQLPRLGVGLGFRREIARDIFAHLTEIDWLEFVPENYMNMGGTSINWLEIAASRFPLVSHGVSLSVGSADELDLAYLTALRSLLDSFPVPWFSDHICYSSAGGLYLHDLLPLPRSKKLVEHIAKRVRQTQEFIGRPMLLENISYYLDMPGSEMTEAEFVSAVIEQSDCGLLLDLNNVVVNSINHKFDAGEYLEALPLERTVQIHMAGHKRYGEYIIDTHGEAISEKCYELLRFVLSRTSVNAVMIERDQNFPLFSDLLAELRQIRALYNELQETHGEPTDEERESVKQAISIIEGSQSLPDELLTPGTEDFESQPGEITDRAGTDNETTREIETDEEDEITVPSSMEGQLPDDISTLEGVADNVVPMAKAPDDREPLDFIAWEMAMANFWLKNAPLPKQMRKGKPAEAARLYSWLIASGHDHALRTMYPSCARALGSDWAAVAFDYFRKHSPEHYSLSLFGQAFSEYLDSRNDLTDALPYLTELATFERAKLEVIEAEATVNATPFTGLKTEEELRDLAPVLNPVLTMKSFEYPIVSLCETIRKKGRPDSIERSPSSLAIFRDPETAKCRISALSSTATKIILTSMQQRLSYADLIHNFVSRDETADLLKGTVELIDLFTRLHRMRIFIGSEPARLSASL